MRRLLSVILAVLAPAALWCRADDGTQTAREVVLASMDAYLSAIDALPADRAGDEVDFMISSVGDSVLRNSVAVKAYNHFRHSPVMGSENVAVHIYDRWFATYETLFEHIEDLDEAEFYAYINRRSLLGVKGERLALPSVDSDTLAVPFPNGRRSIIYFYSTDCPKCLYTSVKLCELMKGLDPDVDFFAVYTGNDTARWQSYISRELAVESSRAAVYHLCGGDSDFVLAYGVVQTPRLFLLDGSGRIIGRNLDVDALSTLLD